MSKLLTSLLSIKNIFPLNLSNYNYMIFIPTTKMSNEIPQKALYFNDNVNKSTDIYDVGMKHHETNIAEFSALGFAHRFKTLLHQASRDNETKQAKYIVFKSSALGYKYKNPNIGVLINNDPNAKNDFIIEYDIYSSSDA